MGSEAYPDLGMTNVMGGNTATDEKEMPWFQKPVHRLIGPIRWFTSSRWIGIALVLNWRPGWMKLQRVTYQR